MPAIISVLTIWTDGRTAEARAADGATKDDGGVSLIAVAAVHNRGVGKQKQRRGEAAWEEARKPRKKRNNSRTMRLCARAFGRSVGLAARRRHEVDYVRAGGATGLAAAAVTKHHRVDFLQFEKRHPSFTGIFQPENLDTNTRLPLT